MGRLTEQEIFTCLAENFRLAAEDCEKLARSARKGPTYHALRDRLEILEGACRQAGVWRDDARWFQIGLYMAECHKRAGEWLRGIKGAPGQPRIKVAPGHMHPLFMKLAEHLRALQAQSDDLRTKATGRVGTILPVAQRAPLRDTTPVGWRRPSGLIVPDGVRVH